MNWAAFAWFVVMVICIIAEANTVAVVSTWFAVGALAAMIVSLLGGQLWLQGVVFVVVSAALLLLLRPVLKKYFTPKLTKTNIDTVVGATGVVTQKIPDSLTSGQVKLGAMEWSARSTDGSDIPEGFLVKVDRLEGVKVYVTKL